MFGLLNIISHIEYVIFLIFGTMIIFVKIKKVSFEIHRGIILTPKLNLLNNFKYGVSGTLYFDWIIYTQYFCDYTKAHAGHIML